MTENKRIIRRRMAAIFNEWAKRYANSPHLFDRLLDENGQPITDYGDRCAAYFDDLASEMDASGVLPPGIASINVPAR